MFKRLKVGGRQTSLLSILLGIGLDGIIHGDG
jgi:hypothetical protein